MIVYKTTNLTNGKFYVGQDKNNNPSYLGSGTILQNALSKYGRASFVKEVLEICTTQDELDKAEEYWIAELDACNLDIAYNLKSCARGGHTTKYYSPEQLDEYGAKLSHSSKQMWANRTQDEINELCRKIQTKRSQSIERFVDKWKTTYHSKSPEEIALIKARKSQGAKAQHASRKAEDKVKRARAARQKAIGRKRMYLPDGSFKMVYPSELGEAK